MLHVSKISKSYGINTVLSEVSFAVNVGERVALVGENGSGKSTLLRLVAGFESVDAGCVQLAESDSVGYLSQALEFDPDESVGQVLARVNAEHSRAWAAMQHYAQLMSSASDAELESLTTAYTQAEARFEMAGGFDLDIRLNAVLSGLGLENVSRQLPAVHLSGGQKTRLGLARLLIRQPQLLLLDEPTNHLDGEALLWLEAWLSSYNGAALIVSHDRTFLDAVTTRTLVINSVTHTMRDFVGNYTAYLDTVTHEIEQQWQNYQHQQREIAQLQSAVRRLRGQAKFKPGGKADSGDKFAKGFFSNRSAGTVARAKHIEQRLERLLADERIDKPARQWQLRVNFAKDDGGARQVLRLEQVKMAFDSQVLLDNVSLMLTHGQRVVLTGPNGQGKTTLLRLIAGELTPTRGEIYVGSGVKLGYFAQEQEVLNPAVTPYDTIRAAAENMSQTEVRNFLHWFLFSGDDVFISVDALSYGERARLMLALLVVRGCNFLLLDEPINHLDIPSRERFEQALYQFPGTILAVAHDRTFIQRMATSIWELRNGQIKIIPVSN